MDESRAAPESEPVRARLSPRYVAILVVVAALVLAAGRLLRPKQDTPVVVPTRELATLPERSQRRVMRDLAGYIGERTGALGTSVIYVPDLAVSGLVVGRDSALTVSSDSAPAATVGRYGATPRVLLVGLGPGDARSAPATLGAVDSVSPRWTLVVARSEEQRPLSLAGLIGGVGQARCGEVTFRELLFDAPVPEAFTGGTMFDLDGNALAMAVPCGGRVALVPLADLMSLLARQNQPEHVVWTRFGFRAAEVDSVTRALLGVDSGLVVTELLVGSLADGAGLRAGDVLLGSTDLAALAGSPDDARLRVRRAGAGVALTLAPDPPSEADIEIVTGPARQPPGLSIRRLPADSRAARAGLQPGDRILRIGRDPRPTPAAVRRALADTVPVLLVYERAGHRQVLVLE